MKRRDRKKLTSRPTCYAGVHGRLGAAAALHALPPDLFELVGRRAPPQSRAAIERLLRQPWAWRTAQLGAA